jgi:hypothetical protein
MSKCQRCGSELKEGNKFCDNCGAFVPVPVVITVMPRRRFNWLPWVVGLVTAATALLLISVIALELYRRSTGYYESARFVYSDIKVKGAVDDTYVTGPSGEEVKFTYPKVEIRGKNTNTANRKIKRNIEDYVKNGRKGDYAADYTYYINRNTVAVIVEVQSLKEDHSSKYFVYNITTTRGNTIRDGDIVKRYGIESDEFFRLVEKSYKRYFKSVNLTEVEKEKMLGLISYSHLDPYLNDDGHLCFATEIIREDGSRQGALFDTDTLEYLEGPLED